MNALLEQLNYDRWANSRLIDAMNELDSQSFRQKIAKQFSLCSSDGSPHSMGRRTVARTLARSLLRSISGSGRFSFVADYPHKAP